MVKTMERIKNLIDQSAVDVLDVLEEVIKMAHTGHYDQLRLRRDRFTELMFAPRQVMEKKNETKEQEDEEEERSSGHSSEEEDDDDDEVKQDSSEEEEEGTVPGEDKMDPFWKGDDDRKQDVDGEDSDSEYERDAAECLNNEIEKDALVCKELTQIREELRMKNQLDSTLLRLLHRLDELNVTVGHLQITEIGKDVNALRHNPSAAVKSLARKIVRDWKVIVEGFHKDSEKLVTNAENAPSSSDMGDDEVGLPSPPLDVGGLMVSSAPDMEISKIMEEMEDLSPPRSEPCLPIAAKDPERVFPERKRSFPQEQSRNATPDVLKTDKNRLTNVERRVNLSKGPVPKSTSGMNPPRTFGLYPGRYVWPAHSTVKPEVKAPTSYFEKLQASKLKLNANYQSIELTKRQRTTQALDLSDLPKGGGPKAAQRPGQNRGYTGRK